VSAPSRAEGSAASFYSPRRGRLHVSDIYEVTLLRPAVWGRTVGCPCRLAVWSMTPGAVIVLAGPLTIFRACPCPVVPVDGVVVTAEGAVPCVG